MQDGERVSVRGSRGDIYVLSRFGQVYEAGDHEGPPPKRVTIYLSTEDEALRRLIRETIISDARAARTAAAAE